MTEEEFKTCAEAVIKKSAEYRRDHGEAPAVVFLRRKSGVVEAHVCDLGGDAVKAGFKIFLKRRIEQLGDVDAVFFVSDTWITGDLTPNGQKIREKFEMTLQQAAAAGLCTVNDCMVVVGETPELRAMWRQKYRQGPPVELIGELEYLPEKGDFCVAGRFTGFFKENPPKPIPKFKY